MNKCKVKILIGSPVIGRTYLSQEFLQGYEDPIFVFSSQLHFSAAYKMYAAIMFKVLSIKYACRSKTFRYRLIRTTGIFDVILSIGLGKCNWKALLGVPLKVLTLIVLIPFAFFPRSILSTLNGMVPIGRQNRETLADCDILIFPFTAYEIEQLMLPKLCKEENIKLIYIADNWDNLSSKTVILDEPDCIFVWGEQSVQHAKEIQGFKESIIRIGSSPRLQVYRDISKTAGAPKVLGFLGAFMYFDEVTVINRICEMLPANWRLLYRPHPWAMKEQELALRDLHEKASLDLNSEGIQDISIDGTRNFFEKVDCTIGGLTTMVLESLVAGRPCIALAIGDGPYNFYSPKVAYANYTHFEGIEKLKNFCILANIEDFPSAFLRLISAEPDQGCDEALEFYVDTSRPANIKRVLECH